MACSSFGLQDCSTTRTVCNSKACSATRRPVRTRKFVGKLPVQAQMASTAHSSADFAVIGGGPGGLACAAAIRVALGSNVNVKVYESLPEYKPQGSGLVLMPNAQYALQAIDPELFERFRDNALTPGAGSGTHVDLRGNYIQTIDPGLINMEPLKEKYGVQPLLLSWHATRQLLADFLPPGIVQFNSQVQHYEEVTDGTVIHFSDGRPAEHAKFVIGADGFFSKVRKQCLNDGPPDFAGRVLWRACVSEEVARPEDPDALKSKVYREPAEIHDPNVHPDAVFFPTGSKSGKIWAWTLRTNVKAMHKAGVEYNPGARPMESVQGKAVSGNAHQNALKIFDFMPDDLMDVVKRTDPSTVTQHGLYIREPTDDPNKTWGRGRVTLIGDAAHAFLPNGQGLCLALEDAVVLAWHLKQQGLTEEALRRYERERLPRVKAVYERGVDGSLPADKEEVLYKPTFKALWKSQADSDPDATCINNFPCSCC